MRNELFYFRGPLTKKLISYSRGVSAIEFLFVLPIAPIMFAILHNVGCIVMKGNITRVAPNITDILSQTYKKNELAVPWVTQYGVPGTNGQPYLLMSQLLVFPDKITNLVYNYANTNGVQVKDSGKDRVFLYLHPRRGRIAPQSEVTFINTSRLAPEVVVAVDFSLPFLSKAFFRSMLTNYQFLGGGETIYAKH